MFPPLSITSTSKNGFIATDFPFSLFAHTLYFIAFNEYFVECNKAWYIDQ